MRAEALADQEDVQLLARCRAGEEFAWKALHDAYFGFVWRVARRLGTPPEELEDVCQETFLIVFQKIDQFEQGVFTTWLYRIAANVASGRHRRRRMRRALQGLLGSGPEPAPPHTPHQQLESRQSEAQVAQVLERLAPKKREVFALFELEGLSGEEISRMVGCTVGTVWTRLHHARKDFEQIARKRGVLR